jgi:hypothetical protein
MPAVYNSIHGQVKVTGVVECMGGGKPRGFAPPFDALSDVRTYSCQNFLLSELTVSCLNLQLLKLSVVKTFRY